MSGSPLLNYAGAFGYLCGAIRNIAESATAARAAELLRAIEEAEHYAESGTLAAIATTSRVVAPAAPGGEADR